MQRGAVNCHTPHQFCHICKILLINPSSQVRGTVHLERYPRVAVQLSLLRLRSLLVSAAAMVSTLDGCRKPCSLWLQASCCCRLLLVVGRQMQISRHLLRLCVAPGNTHSYLKSQAHSQNTAWETRKELACWIILQCYVLFTASKDHTISHECSIFFFHLLCSPMLNRAILISSYFYLMDKVMWHFSFWKTTHSSCFANTISCPMAVQKSIKKHLGLFLPHLFLCSTVWGVCVCAYVHICILLAHQLLICQLSPAVSQEAEDTLLLFRRTSSAGCLTRSVYWQCHNCLFLPHQL